MVRFSQFDDFKPVSAGGTRYTMSSGTTWEVGRKGSGFVLNLEPGRPFDISIPRWLAWFSYRKWVPSKIRRLLSPHNRLVLMPARVHDQLLEDGFDQAFASSEFRRALRARGAGGVYAWLLFFVTLFATAFKGKSTHHT